MTEQEAREKFLLILLRYANEGIPYLWGGRLNIMGDGSKPPYPGVDCSGTVLAAWAELRGSRGTLLPWGWTTDDMWSDRGFRPVAVPKPGTLIFWPASTPKHPNDVAHVEVILGEIYTRSLGRGWRTVGAIGGDSSIMTLRAAKDANARVRIREHTFSRGPHCGFRELPWESLGPK